MAKKLALMVVVIITMINMAFLLYTLNNVVEGTLLDKAVISFDFSDSEKIISRDEFLNIIKQFSDENGIEIAQYSFLRKNSIDIYSTKPESYGEVSLVSSLLNNKAIKVHKFEEIGEVGFKNILYFDSKIVDNITKLQSKVKDYCKVYYSMGNDNHAGYNFSGDSESNNPALFFMYSTAIFLLIFFNYMFQRKNYFIYKVWGYRQSKIYLILIKPIYIPLLLTIFLENLVLGVILYRCINFNLALNIFLTTLKMNTICITIFFLCSFFLFFILFFATDLKKRLEKIMVLTYVLRVLIFFIVISSVGLLFNKKIELKEKLETLNHWKNTYNIYNLYESYTHLDDNDLKAEDKVNKKIFSVYSELSDLNSVFILETSNFERLASKENKSKDIEDNYYSYEVNIKKEEDLYSPYGKNIIVDDNYLKKNNIKSSDGENVANLIINDDKILNILVPRKFKKYKTSIVNTFKEWFCFQKFEVTNQYRQAKGERILEKDIDSLQLNIIYIQDGLKIFTYNSRSGDNNNIIEDSIITVYTRNVDNSFLASCFGPFIFIEFTDEHSALKEIQNITWKYGINELNNVVSVYDQKGEEIDRLETTIKQLSQKIAIVLSLFIVLLIFIIYIYCVSSSKMITIKVLHGYNFRQIFKRIFLSNMAISVSMLIFAIWSFINIWLYMVTLIALTVVVDYIVIYLMYNYLVINGKDTAGI